MNACLSTLVYIYIVNPEDLCKYICKQKIAILLIKKQTLIKNMKWNAFKSKYFK